MIVTVWLTAVPDPHYVNTTRKPDLAELTVLNTIGDHEAVVLADGLGAGRLGNVEVVEVESFGGNPYHDRWRQVDAWLRGRPDDEFVWSTDANDVTLLNDPYPDWLRNDTLYVGSEPVDGPNARNLGFWWMTGLHPDHTDWLAANAHLPLLNAGLLGGTVAVLREFLAELVDHLDGCNDVTDMAAVNWLLYERWTDRYFTGPPVHTPMWSFVTEHPEAIWAHK